MKSNSYKFAVIGGDKRQLFLIASLLSDGYSVLAGGFDSLSGSGDISFVGVEQAIAHSDIIILPLPAVCADGSLNAPFDSEKIIFSEDVQTMLRSKLVFAGMSDRLVRSYPQLSGAKVYDYSIKEEFSVLNSVPTAEGALALAMQKSERTIWGSKIMIIGYGRIGKSLSRLASSMGAAVTVCARGSGDRAAAQTLGTSLGTLILSLTLFRQCFLTKSFCPAPTKAALCLTLPRFRAELILKLPKGLG